MKQATILHTTGKTSTIAYDPTVPCLIDTINEFLISVEFRAHLNKGLELLIEKKAVHGEIGWLANTKAADAFLDEDSKWLIEDWSLRVAQAGIKYIAMVLPDDMITQMVFFEGREDVWENGIVCKHFIDLEMAKKWLANSLS